MAAQNQFKQNEERIIGRVDYLLKNNQITTEQAKQIIQTAQQQAEAPASMQEMFKQEHAYRMAGGMPTGAGEDGITMTQDGGRSKGPLGEVPFQSALRNFSFTDGQPSRLPSGIPAEAARKIQGYGGGGAGTPITAPGMGNGEYYTGPPGVEAEVRMQQEIPPQQRGPVQGPEYMQPVMKHRQSEISKRGLLGMVGDQVGEAVSPVTGALRGMGKAAGGYMKSLFDDPSRMAMLQGGLSMMDPNSYYDKQGFGSVFTGLNKGLGAATSGHEGVLARRKAVADRKLVDAKIGSEGEDSRKYKSAQIGDGTYLYSDADIIQLRNEIMAGGKVGWQAATDMAIKQAGTKIDKGMTPKQTSDIQFDYDAGQNKIVEMDEAITLAQDALNTGIVGLGKRGWNATRGFFSVEGDDDNSTKLVNAINSITSQNWKELVGAGGLTAGDKDFLQKVIHNPQSVFTTRASIEKGLRKLRGIQMKAQHSRAKELGIPFSKVNAGAGEGKYADEDEFLAQFGKGDS